MVRVEKGLVEHEFVLIYYFLHCHLKQGCQRSKYPTGYYTYIQAYNFRIGRLVKPLTSLRKEYDLQLKSLSCAQACLHVTSLKASITSSPRYKTFVVVSLGILS